MKKSGMIVGLCAGMSLCAFQAAMATNLGIANDYNLFILNDCFTSSDSWGNVAVGGNGSFSGYSAASTLSGPNAKLVVGGNLSWTGGDIGNPGLPLSQRGDIYVGGNANVRQVGYSHLYRQQDVVDFNAAEDYLTAASSAWSELPSSGTSEKKWGSLYLTGTHSDLNVFNLTSSDVVMYTLFIDAPKGSTVLVTVDGSQVTFANFGVVLTGVTRDKILFNLPDATNLSISGCSFQGSILAPDAAVNFSAGNMEGTLVGKSYGSAGNILRGEMHSYPFQGNLPEVPEPATLLFILAGTVCLSKRRGIAG